MKIYLSLSIKYPYATVIDVYVKIIIIYTKYFMKIRDQRSKENSLLTYKKIPDYVLYYIILRVRKSLVKPNFILVYLYLFQVTI